MNSMNYLGKFISNFRYVYNEINAATLTGAIDVIVVEQLDGSFTCSPFHVRFGKIGVLRSREKVVDIEINGEPVDIHMKLGESGEAFFVEEVPADELGDDDFIPPHLACSPIPISSGFADRFLVSDDQDADDPTWKGFNKQILEVDEDAEPSSTPKVVIAGGSVPKTFRAETIENETTRLAVNTANSEFRPISGTNLIERNDSEGSLEVVPSKSATDLTKEESPVVERTSTSLPGSKRRRRKKSVLKKKNNSSTPRKNNNNINNEQHTENFDKKETVDSVPMFQMEDLDQSAVSSLQLVAKDSEDSNDSELMRLQDTTVESDLHFFSDTELTGCSPHGNREFSPVQSDTEFETKRGAGGVDGSDNKTGDELQQSWKWGQLPTSNHEETTGQEAARSVLHNMLGFMKKTKHIRHNPESEGIYLSDLKVDELDPEVAALYFPTSYKQSNQLTSNPEAGGHDEDAESGNGPSLPHSPHSVEGAIGGSKSLDSDFEEPKHSVFERRSYGEISMSLCGGLNTPNGPSEEQFLQHLVTYEDLANDPMLVENPNLVVRLDGKLYNWRSACPIIMSLVIYQKPLPQEVTSRLTSDLSPQPSTDGSIADSNKRKPSSRRSYSSWFTWGARAPASPAGGTIVGTETSRTSQEVKTEVLVSSAEETEQPKEDKIISETTVINEPETPITESPPLQLSSDTDKHEEKERGYAGSNSSDDSESENDKQRSKLQSLTIPLDRNRRLLTSSDKYRKTLRLTSEQIASLNLRDGANEVEFSVTTAYQGTSRCKCFLFKWRYDDKIVVSDIDGTITKSDVLGHILPIVGKDWAQSGVAKLFTKIKDNGYKLLYLSARAIGQSRLTREYLKSIKQEDLSLPEGPMLLNPTSLLTAFHTEVIEKKPEEFKISCLRDIQALFPPNSKPFYAGYGNKINDVWAYQAVGIPIFRIFTINHRGELKHELTQTFQSSYSKMSYIVDQMFPATHKSGQLLDDFSQFYYWREPIPELDLDAITSKVTDSVPSQVSS